MAFPRNIFQDVMHQDTLVKSFIDEVSLHDSLSSELYSNILRFGLDKVYVFASLSISRCFC